MKVTLLVRTIDTFGGNSRNAANLAAAIAAAGYSVETVAYTGSALSFFRVVRGRARSADAVVAVDLNPIGMIAYLATRFTSAKFVLVCQAAYAIAPLYSRKTGFLARSAYCAADVVVCGSAFLAREVHKKVPNLPIDVIDPGIDLSRLPQVDASRAPEHPPFMLSVGAVKVRKGHDVSLRAFALLKKDVPDLRYVVIGALDNEPGFVGSLRSLARELGVEQDYDLHGEVSDEELAVLYRRASLFILPSVNEGLHFEGFGMVFLEAAAYGVPSVGTLGNGIEDAVEDGKTGFLVPQRDPAATASAAKRILTDADLAARMSVRAREFAREHDIAHLVEKYRSVFRRIGLS